MPKPLYPAPHSKRILTLCELLTKKYPFSWRGGRTAKGEQHNIKSQRIICRVLLRNTVKTIAEPEKQQAALQLSALLARKLVPEHFMSGIFLKERVKLTEEELRLAKKIGIKELSKLAVNIKREFNTAFNATKKRTKFSRKWHNYLRGAANALILLDLLEKTIKSRRQ